MTDILKERFIKAKRRLFDLYYSDLNERQREAVYSVKGPLLVLAGAGSGKTTVLVRRIAHILRFGDSYYDDFIPATVDENAVRDLEIIPDTTPKEMIASILDMYSVPAAEPWQIMTITFTNKAANEMKTRLSKILGEEKGQSVVAGTFHSVCVRILRRYVDFVELKPGFTIYDTDDSKKMLSGIIKDMNLDDKMFPVKSIMNLISRAKDCLMTPEEFYAENKKDYVKAKIGQIFMEYQNRMREANAVDFDDIIFKTVTLLRDNEDARTYYQRRFRIVCIDEYQDTNRAQFELAKLLSGTYKNIMVVGDEDQSIYKFRGATIENILTYDKTFPEAKTVKLEQNYRSVGNILEAANAVIKNNKSRIGKTLWSANGQGDKVSLHKLHTQIDEGRFIINKITELTRNEGLKYGDFAILFRMNAQSNSIEKALVRSGFPYRLLAGTKFYERKEVKDILAYLTLIINRNDNLRLERVINEPKRKIGLTTVTAIKNIADSEGISMFDVMKKAGDYPAIAKSADKLGEFCALIDGFEELSASVPLNVLFEQVIEKTGYKDMLLAAGIEEADRLQNVQELVTNAVEYINENPDGNLRDFLETVSLMSDIDDYNKDADAIVLMTIHSAKGLEFPVVFIVGMEEGIFPGLQSMESPDELEEERRLAYVAITRAKKRLYLSCVHERVIFGRSAYNRPSRFISEIPSGNIELVDEFARMVEEHRSGSFKQQVKAPVLPPKRSETAGSTEKVVFSAGDRVIHPTFGMGEILSATRMGNDYLYEIAFDKVGTKKLMGAYCRMKKA